MEHLSLEIFGISAKADNPELEDGKYAVLDDDTSITITDTSEIFASGDVWSHSFTLNVNANTHIFGTSGDLHGSRLHDQINKRRARLWVDGLPLYIGYLMLDDEADVDADGNVNVKFESGQKTFEEKIEGATANQVPMMRDVCIGMALWRDRYTKVRVKTRAYVTMRNASINGMPSQHGTIGDEVDNTYITLPVPTDDNNVPIEASTGDDSVSVYYPKMVFPKGAFKDKATGESIPVNELNTDSPYSEDQNGTPTYPYCNVSICYQKYGYPTKNGAVDYSADQQKLQGYETAPANRVNSAPNFYVIFWLRCLMKHLGINIQENQMNDIEDLRRLFFVNTNCAYEVPKTFDRTGGSVDPRFGCFKVDDAMIVSERREKTVDTKESKLNVDDYTWEEWKDDSWQAIPSNSPYAASYVKVEAYGQYDVEDPTAYFRNNRIFHYAYATSDCFPNVDISEVIKGLESGFGIRLLFDRNYQNVRIILLRNIFRNDDIQEIDCDIEDGDVMVDNCIRGFRMTYGKGKDDTTFYYKGFADKMQNKKQLWEDVDLHDYSRWKLDAQYGDLIKKITAFDRTCYVTPVNGNAYGIKVDGEAKGVKDLHESLFEFAGFQDAQDGDCSGDESTIETVTVGFAPAIMNDVNFDKEKKTGSKEQQFALFVKEDMLSRRFDYGNLNPETASYNDSGVAYSPPAKEASYYKLGLFSVSGDIPYSSNGNVEFRRTLVTVNSGGYNYDLTLRFKAKLSGYIKESYLLWLQDNFSPNDDGIAPIETHDWGLTLGIMRGSGSGASVEEGPCEGDPDNHTWEIVPGKSAVSHPDTCDSYGNTWDYNFSVLISTPAEAIAAMREQWPDSNFQLTNRNSSNYLVMAVPKTVKDDKGNPHKALFAVATKDGWLVPGFFFSWLADYCDMLAGKSVAEMYIVDASEKNVLIEVDSSSERLNTLIDLQAKAFGGSTKTILLDNGVGSMYGRFSLKLRAEKQNPYYKEGSTDQDKKDRYLTIDSEELRGRGLADQFYTEYSYWVRNARIVKRKVHMELAQLLSIDKTKRVRVGDVMGFIRKMQYSVSNKTGLGGVTMEIMYI